MAKAREPSWLLHGRKLVGTQEAAGTANSATILGWAKRLGAKVVGMIYNADSVPWCGLFVATCMSQAGIAPTATAVRAKSWSTWGSRLRLDRLAPGAVLVFDRPGGGHVGFYIGEDASHFHVLGGNQGDKVSIMRLERSRCIAARWPPDEPVIGGPVRMMKSAGVPVSRDEA